MWRIGSTICYLCVLLVTDGSIWEKAGEVNSTIVCTTNDELSGRLMTECYTYNGGKFQAIRNVKCFLKVGKRFSSKLWFLCSDKFQCLKLVQTYQKNIILSTSRVGSHDSSMFQRTIGTNLADFAVCLAWRCSPVWVMARSMFFHRVWTFRNNGFLSGLAVSVLNLETQELHLVWQLPFHRVPPGACDPASIVL
jgi:hypothetical protein